MTGEVHFSSMLDAAKFWTSKGFDVFPLKPMSDEPYEKYFIEHASHDIDKLKEWFTDEPITDPPQCNIGTAFRLNSPLFDLDVDGFLNTRLREWRKFSRDKKIPRTLMQQTRSNNLHFTYKAPFPMPYHLGVFGTATIRCGIKYSVRAPSVVLDKPINRVGH